MPFVLLTCSTAYFAPSTSLAARAERIPVSGSTMPMRTVVSPRARIIGGEARAVSARLDLSRLRRPKPGLILFCTDVSLGGLFAHCACYGQLVMSGLV